MGQPGQTLELSLSLSLKPTPQPTASTFDDKPDTPQ
jgi:hypothetical protein